MKYQPRINHQSQFDVNNPNDEFTFVNNHLSKPIQCSLKLEQQPNIRQLSSSDQTQSSQTKLRQSLGQTKSRQLQKSKLVNNRTLKHHDNEKPQRLHDSQLIYRRINNSRSNYPKCELENYQCYKETGDQIYKEIIRILEVQNKNLKQQNLFFINQHKKIVSENLLLVAQIQQLKTNNALHLQIQKLNNLNQVYQNQLQQLKYILLEEVSAIHQKLNSCMSQEQASSIYNDLNDSFKISVSGITLNQSNFTHQNKSKGRQLLATHDFGTILSQMLELDANDTFEKSPEKTVETIDKEKNNDYLNLDFNFIESPTDTTFSGNLRSSN